MCVAIGYSFRDDHIKAPLLEASQRGLTIIDVNPDSVVSGFARYRRIMLGAKKAFESGAILDAINLELDNPP